MTRRIEFLDFEDVTGLAALLLGDPPPIRDVGLLGSAVARPAGHRVRRGRLPRSVVEGGRVLQSIVNNHALIDGNKRLGWLATAVFFELYGVAASSTSNDDVYGLVMQVALTRAGLDDIAGRLGAITTRSH